MKHCPFKYVTAILKILRCNFKNTALQAVQATALPHAYIYIRNAVCGKLYGLWDFAVICCNISVYFAVFIAVDKNFNIFRYFAVTLLSNLII